MKKNELSKEEIDSLIGQLDIEFCDSEITSYLKEKAAEQIKLLSVFLNSEGPESIERIEFAIQQVKFALKVSINAMTMLGE